MVCQRQLACANDRVHTRQCSMRASPQMVVHDLQQLLECTRCVCAVLHWIFGLNRFVYSIRRDYGSSTAIGPVLHCQSEAPQSRWV